jgi:hypothetical protein
MLFVMSIFVVVLDQSENAGLAIGRQCADAQDNSTHSFERSEVHCSHNTCQPPGSGMEFFHTHVQLSPSRRHGEFRSEPLPSGQCVLYFDCELPTLPELSGQRLRLPSKMHPLLVAQSCNSRTRQVSQWNCQEGNRKQSKAYAGFPRSACSTTYSSRCRSCPCKPSSPSLLTRPRCSAVTMPGVKVGGEQSFTSHTLQAPSQ